MPNRRLAVPTEGDSLVVYHQVGRWADEQPGDDRVAVFSEVGLPELPSTQTGDIRVHGDFESPQLGNRRDILVYLPPGYDASPTERYPVLYMHDGQNVFDQRTSFKGQEWALDEAAEQLIRTGRIGKCIIVAIGHSSMRDQEFTRFAAGGGGPEAGDRYLHFVVETVKPFIDRTYRTLPDRSHTWTGGASFAGVVVLQAAIRHGDVFGGVISLAPSLWVNQRQTLQALRKTEIRPDTRFFIGQGRGSGVMAYVASKTGRNPELRDGQELVEILEEKGISGPGKVQYVVIPSAFHEEAAWARQGPAILGFAFGKALGETASGTGRPDASPRLK
jgi:predicted alpha/beta superfamily hydrolase